MNKIFLLLILFFSVNLYAQEDIVELGILPTEYAEGMPPAEFLEIEEKIIEALKAVPRYKIVKEQEDFYEAKLGDDWYAQIEAIRKEGKQNNVPYLLQIVFGDTEWASKLEPLYTVKPTPKAEEPKESENKAKNTASKNTTVKSKETQTTKKTKTAEKPKTTTATKTEAAAKIPKVWTHNATIWVTINLYKVETGQLMKSNTYKAASTSDFRFQKASIKSRGDYKYAVSAAKTSILSTVKKNLYTLILPEIDLVEATENTNKSVKKVAINAGTFHGLSLKQRLYVYYEHEHMINGKAVIREIYAGFLIIEEIQEKTAICKVKKGGKELLKLLNENRDLKCNIKNFINWVDGYGF